MSSTMHLLPPQLIAELLVLGCCTGFLAGLLGIGGGMLLVPFMTFLMSARHFPPDLIVKMAIATSLATICFTSISSVRAHHRHGAVQWKLAFRLAPGILVGSYAGAWLATQMNSRSLALFFAFFVAFSATQMFIDRKPAAARTLPGPTGLFAAGGGIGALAGLVGAGGGFVSVPFMVWCNVGVHRAVATSAALGFPIALAGTLSYMVNGLHLAGTPPGSIGYVFVPALLAIAASSVLTAPFGARLAHRLDTRQLKRLFAVLLYALAAYMLWKGLRG